MVGRALLPEALAPLASATLSLGFPPTALDTPPQSPCWLLIFAKLLSWSPHNLVPGPLFWLRWGWSFVFVGFHVDDTKDPHDVHLRLMTSLHNPGLL